MTKYGVAHYEGTAALKVKAPEARPALPPPPAQELQEEELLALMHVSAAVSRHCALHVTARVTVDGPQCLLCTPWVL